MTNLDQIKNKIRALSAKTVENGASESEAFSAMKMIGKLLNEYNLSMDEISVREELCITDFVSTNNKHVNEQVYVSSYVAKLCSVKAWIDRSITGIKIFFFGLEPDVQMAIYLVNVVGVVFESEFKQFKKGDYYKSYQGHRKVLASNFQKGYSSRINERLVEMISENKKQMATNSTGTALVVVEKSKFVDEEFQKSQIKLVSKKNYSKSSYNANARMAGIAAGNKPTLSRPIAQ